MANIFGFDVPIDMPKFGGPTANSITAIFIIFLVFLIGAVVIYLLYDRRLFNKKIVVFENISGQGFQPVFYDKAKTVKLGDGGEELLYLKKKKVYRSAYGRKMGKNTYWFCIGSDGYWYNILLGDLDAKMGMLDVEPIQTDMRYMHVAVRKNIQERYRKIGFMEKYGTIMMMGIFLLIMIAGIWFMLDKINGISGSVSGSVSASERVITSTQQILSSLDNICGGSGIKPA